MQSNKITPQTTRHLWRNWAAAFGCPAIVTVASTFIPPIWLPLVCIALAYALILQHRQRVYSTDGPAQCSMVGWLTAMAMLGSAVLMTVINIVYSAKVLPAIVAENPALPFLASMIVYPMMCAASVYGLIMERDNHCCGRCQANHGYYSDSDPVALLYFNESIRQLRLSLILSALIFVVDLAYYYLCYTNVNLNSPDRFFFVVMPCCLYVLSVIYMVRHYFTMYVMVLKSERDSRAKGLGSNVTLVRILLLSGDFMLLSKDEDGLWDTPVQKQVAHCDTISEYRARQMVKAVVPTEDFNVREIYSNTGYATGANILHYAAVFNDNIAVSAPLERFNIDRIQRSLREQSLSPMVANELYRIHAITMAWKTYDREGRRLYPIKNYRPTFRLRDFENWTVDYNDSLWLRISTNNQDRPLWRVRRFVNRLLFPKKSRTD